MLVDLITKFRTRASFEVQAANRIQPFLEKRGVEVRRICLIDGTFADYLQLLKSDPPNWTLSFEDLFSIQKPVCDILQIPHILWNVRTLAYAAHYFEADFATVSFDEKEVCDKLDLLYLPYSFEPQTKQRPIFDTVLQGDLVDFDSLRRTWEALFSEEMVQRIQRACKLCEERTILPIEAALRHFSFEERNDATLAIEKYLAAKKVLEIVHTFSGERLDLFGEHVGKNWLTRLPTNIHLHASLPFTEWPTLYTQAKQAICLDAHSERCARACGALPPQEEERIETTLERLLCSV